MFLSFSFYFHFLSSIIFTFTFHLFDLVLHLLFPLVFMLIVFIIIFPTRFLEQKIKVKANSFILFFSRHIWIYDLFFHFLWKHVLNFYFSNLYDFYLIAVSILYLIYLLSDIMRRSHNVFGSLCRVSFLATFVAGVLELGEKWSLGVFKNNMLSARLCVGMFSTFMECCTISF